MTAVQHLYVTAHGSYNSGPWLGESAQFGLRLAIVGSVGAPDKGTIFTMGLNGDVAVDQGTQAGPNGVLTRTWTARRGPVGSTDNMDAGFQIDVAEDVRKFLDSIKTYQRNTFSWKAIKLAPISAAGKTIGTSSIYTLSPVVGSSATAQLPPQCAVAVSMRANILGRRGRGRIYLPAFHTTAVDNDAILTSTVGTNLRTYMKTLIDDLQNLPGVPDTVPLVVVTSAGSSTAVRPSEVRTGNRIDTIRSRREQVPEVYTALAL